MMNWGDFLSGDRKRKDHQEWQQQPFWEIHRDQLWQEVPDHGSEHEDLSLGEVQSRFPGSVYEDEDAVVLFFFSLIHNNDTLVLFRQTTSETITYSTRCVPVLTCRSSSIWDCVSVCNKGLFCRFGTHSGHNVMPDWCGEQFHCCLYLIWFA